MGCFLWGYGGTHYVHPIQIWQVQLLGSCILLACAFLFVAVHVNMGANWSPEPEQKARHQLVTHGAAVWNSGVIIVWVLFVLTNIILQ